jgi:hypothetical protein
MKFAANLQGMTHAMASDEVLKNALASAAFEQFEAASYRMLVSAAKAAGEQQIADTCSTSWNRRLQWPTGPGANWRRSPKSTWRSLWSVPTRSADLRSNEPANRQPP